VLTELRSTIRALFHRARFENAMDEELRFHIRARVDDLVDSGVIRAEAERRAHLEFGGIEITKDHCREARGLRLIDDIRQDLRYAWRTLVKSPAFTTVAILTLALGIGAVTIIYSVVYNVVIDPLPYKDADRLVNVFVQDTQSRSRVPFVLRFQLRNSLIFVSGAVCSRMSWVRWVKACGTRRATASNTYVWSGSHPTSSISWASSRYSAAPSL
jgi:hypothetical protein